MSTLEWSFEYVVKSILMPAVSLFGLVGNSLSIYILHHKEVKLKRDFVEVLCSLATFDNLLLISTFFLFSLPTLSANYETNVFPYTVPYLYPTCNTFMTCSIYMTVGVAVNRYLDISDSCRQVRRIKSGYLQAAIILVMSAIVNIPRWFEFAYEMTHDPFNITETSLVTGEEVIVEVNRSRLIATPTQLRQNDEYIRDYTLISATVLIVLLPMIIMMLSSILIYRTMEANASIMVFSDAQEQARRRRNRSITLMLFGIIFLFLLCHVGEVFISFYELINVIYGERSAFPAWARITVTVNHLLVVMNSSLNFVIYCKDVVFRRHCAVTILRAWGFGKTVAARSRRNEHSNSGISAAAQQLRTINQELGINVQGDPDAEVVLRELDPQSKILCGISQT